MAEFLADGGADRRCGLNHDELSLLDGFVDFADLAVFGQCARGADFNALPALDAGNLVEGAVLRPKR